MTPCRLLIALFTGVINSTYAEYRTSFEQAPAGTLKQVELSGVTWAAEDRHAEINENYAHTGQQCLRIFGGADRMVQITLPAPLPDDQWLRFAAERWTKRPPFDFRVKAMVDGDWKELKNLTDLRVGARFLSNVRMPLPAGTSALRFHVSAAEPADKAGVLIDDLTIGPPTPEERITDQLRRSTVYARESSTSFAYRIPALVATKEGRILAFAERRTGLADHAKNDIVLRTSDDGGATWNLLQVLAEEGGDSLNDPCAVVL
ncbi:MAG: sialidase family protein, partial [Verrucomicrobiota bacterium]